MIPHRCRQPGDIVIKHAVELAGYVELRTVLGCAMLGTVTPGSIGWAILVFVLATIAFEAGYIFYNAFLPEISTPKTIGRISAWSWGTGFLGGLLALVACFPFLAKPLLDEGGVLDAQIAVDLGIVV